MPELVVHLDDEAAAVARFGPVLYVVWRDPQTPAAVPHLDAAARAILERYGEGRKLLYLHRTPSLPNVARHSSATFDAVMRHFDRHEKHSRAAALALEVTGFSGAVVRSVAAGVTLMRRTHVTTKTFQDARIGVRWLAGEAAADTSFDADVFIQALRSRELCRVVGFEEDYR